MSRRPQLFGQVASRPDNLMRRFRLAAAPSGRPTPARLLSESGGVFTSCYSDIESSALPDGLYTPGLNSILNLQQMPGSGVSPPLCSNSRHLRREVIP